MSEQAVRKLKASGLPRMVIPESDTFEISQNFEEVPYKVSLEMAMDEATRCLQCPKPRCMNACPVHINIPGFIAELARGNIKNAAEILKKYTALPSVCGRVCPQENQCEGSCVLGLRGKAVAIGTLERFVADNARLLGEVKCPKPAEPTGKKVAIVGCGPAGITAASELACLGHSVEIFESASFPGGVLMYGIPKFRLPKKIVEDEVEELKNLGVKIHYNFAIGKDKTIDELFADNFDAVFVASGVAMSLNLGIEGENADGVYSATEFLTRYNLSETYKMNYPKEDILAKNIITIGGGNVAMDSARTALRLGAKSTLVYRRAKEQMPARKIEVEETFKDGVIFELLTSPKRIITDENNKVIGLECVKMELGLPDESGRQSPVEVENSEFVIDCDAVIIAIGNKPDPLISKSTPNLNINKNGTFVCDMTTLKTSIEAVYAGGDIVSGALTVINAMGQAKIAAKNIDEYLKTKI